MLAKVIITLKKGVHDPQGEAVERALSSMGYQDVGHVRMGKYIELKLEHMERSVAEKRVTDVCQKLLANTVIESYRFELE